MGLQMLYHRTVLHPWRYNARQLGRPLVLLDSDEGNNVGMLKETDHVHDENFSAKALTTETMQISGPQLARKKRMDQTHPPRLLRIC